MTGAETTRPGRSRLPALAWLLAFLPWAAPAASQAPSSQPPASPPASPATATRLLGRPAAESPILVRFRGETITVAEFAAEMARRAPQGLESPAGRRALLDQMLLFRVLVAEAREQGYERDPEVAALLERTLVAKLLRDQLDPGLAAVAASDEEIAAYYAAHAGEFAQPARAEAAIVQVAVPPGADPALRAERRRRAEEALAAARLLPPGTAHFGTVAARFSDHRASSAFGGRLGWLAEGEPSRWDAALLRAVFAPPGGVAGEPNEPIRLVEAADGFYLLKVLRRDERRQLPFESLRDGLRARLVREKRELERRRFEAAALAGAAIEIDAGLLATIAPPVRQAGSPGLPPGPPPLPGGSEDFSANPHNPPGSLPGNIP